MARYRFGNYEFPALPEYDRAAYPYLHIACVRPASEDLYFAYALAQPGYYIAAEEHIASVDDAPISGLITLYDADADEWRYSDEVIWLDPGGVTSYPPVWSGYDMYDDTGALHMTGSAPLLILDEESLQVGISVGMSLKGKNTNGAGGTSYVVGTPAVFTLEASKWNGSMYTLYAYLYAAGTNGVQIGLPSKGSSPNTQKVVKAALTINSTYNYAGTTTAQPYARLYIVAANPPAEDLEVAIFGLAPVADTVTATASEEATTEVSE